MYTDMSIPVRTSRISTMSGNARGCFESVHVERCRMANGKTVQREWARNGCENMETLESSAEAF